VSALLIKGREIGRGQPCYIIAEMSANHGQDFMQAVKVVKAAKKAGADAIKLQTYTPDTMTIDSGQERFKIGKGTIWEGRNLYELYGEAYTPWEWQPKLKRLAETLSLDCFSTPFDSTSVEFLEQMQVPAFKIASFELVDLQLIRRVAQTKKPTLMSTGMASLEEIDEAVCAFREAGGAQLALLKCTSAYPAQPEEMNLRTIPDLARRFEVPVGLSDHTQGIAVSVAAVALGACIIEKHFTLSRSLPGPDTPFSLEPREFKALVDAVRTAEKSLGGIVYGATEREQSSRVFRRSLFVIKDAPAGAMITTEHVRSIRPGNGLPPKFLSEVIGRYFSQDVRRGDPLSWELIS
jgi:N-acetylneuraminate synthase